MSEQEKIALLERLAASGANIGQINLGDGHQYFGCSVTQVSSTPSPQPEVVQVVDIIEPSDNSQHTSVTSYPFILKKDKTKDIINLLRKYMSGIARNKPKDMMMPVRAAVDAGVMREPTYSEFKEAFHDVCPKSKSSFGDYLIKEDPAHAHPYSGMTSFEDMVAEFKRLKN